MRIIGHASCARQNRYSRSFGQSYVPGLDGLRGVAILMVLLDHLLLDTRLAMPTLGSGGVEIFFVLNGFLITALLLRKKVKKESVSLRRFYIRRALRILPVAYLFLAVLLLCHYLFDLRLSAGSFMAAALYVKNIQLNYTSNWFNGHFGTLSVEG
jgi:peptidoglycan/LPS O-acetylase OafA/YrhL